MKIKEKKVAIAGFIFGLIAPVFGLFFGLQVSPTLGNIFTFPWIIIAMLTDSAFGYWMGVTRWIAFVFSGLVWSLIFLGIHKIKK